MTLREKWTPLRGAAWLPALLLILVQMSSGMRDLPQFAFFLIYLREQLGLAPAAIARLVAGGQLVSMATALLGGAIAARLGSKWALMGGLALAALSSLAFQAHSLWLVAALWLAGGAGLALITVGGSSYLTRISARGSLGLLAAFYALSMTIGGALGNPIAGVMIERSGFTAFSWAALAVSLWAILIVIFLLPPMHERVAEHASTPASSGPIRTRSGSARSPWAGIASIARQPDARLLAGMRCLATIFYGMLSVLNPLLLNDLSGSKVLVAAYGTTTLVVASAAQLLAGRAADRWGARAPTLVAYTAMILAGLGLALRSGTVWGLFLFGVLGIAAAWSLSTLMYVWVSLGIPRTEHPATFGLLHAVWSLSMITGSVLGGWFVETLPALPFLAAGLLNIGSLFLSLAYFAHIAAKDAAAVGQPAAEPLVRVEKT